MAHVGIVAGESSGDRLGAGLIRELLRRRPGLRVEGVAGPQMAAAGCEVVYPFDRLAVMGIIEVIKRYRELIQLRRRAIAHFLANPPDVFVGIDLPEFNLELEEKLREAGIRTVHYVSPQVWAWRKGRLAQIARATDLMLTLFPFEERYYQQHGIPVRFVGHPLADEMPAEVDQTEMRIALGLPVGATTVALLPGSRVNEWHYHIEPFIRTALWLRDRRPGSQFVVAAADARARALFEATLARIAPGLPVTLFEGRSREVMGAADVVLTVSGTVSLEALLCKRPMVVAYRTGLLNYLIARALVRVPFIALPNLLSGRRVVPEFIQWDVQPQKLGQAVLDWLACPEAFSEVRGEFAALHRALRRDASASSAEAVLQLIER